MTKAEAIAKWKAASGAEPAGKTYVRAGNWEPAEFALRHCTGIGDEITQLAENVVKVTPAKPEGKENAKPRTPFYLVVE